MAEQICHPVESPVLRPKLIAGRFFPNGTSQSALTVDGKGIASVARTGNAGEFTVTLQEEFAKVIAFDGCVQMNAAADLNVQFGAFTNVGTGSPTSFIVRTLAGATGTDISANANNSVSFWVLFNDSGVN